MVPSGWEVKKLRDIGVCLTGLTYKPENVVPNGLLVLRSSNVQNAQLSFDDNVYVNIEIPEKSKTRYGDILLCVRNGSKRLIGKSAFITKDAEGFAHGAFMGLFRPKSNPEYIFQVFQTDDFYRQVHRNLGATINSINSGNLYDFKFAFPPALEQQKIAKILTTWDKAINTTERLIENSKQQKKALMQQLLTGQKRLLDDSGQRFSGDWKEVKLGQVVTYQKGFAFKSSSYKNEGIRIIRISDTTRNSIHDNSPVFINENETASLSKYELKAGDIILTTVGSRPHLLDSMVGKAIQIPINYEGSLLNQNMVKIIPKKNLIDNDYLYLMLKNRRFNYFISTLVRGNANQVSITLKELFLYLLRLPSMDEQQKIAAVLINADREIEVLEQQLADLQQEKKALMQQLLTGKKRVLVD